MITRGESSILVQKIYHYCGDKPFTYKKVAKKLPYIKKSLMTAMHNANVVRLENRKKRAVGISKKNPSVWVFTTEALFLLQKMYGDKND
jgi:hypothetical protein